MKYMLALGASLALATPAAATVQVCDGANCAPSDENVLIIKDLGASILGATNNTHVAVGFTSVTDSLVGDANGQADVSAADGLLNSLKFQLFAGNTFGSAVFNLEALGGNQPNEAISIILTYLLDGGGTGQRTFAINTNGQNDTGIFGTAGERFTSVELIANPSTTGWGDLRQLRLGGVRGPAGGDPVPDAVPEPATWAMMLLGFGGIGMTMRRRASDMRVSYA